MKEFGRKMKEYKEMGRGGRIGNNVKKESKIPKDRESVKNKEETSLLKKTKTGGVLEKAVNSEEKKRCVG